MINVDGKVYSNFNSIDSNQIESFILNTVFEFTLRWENNHILFWEEHYFMMMSQLRRLRLVIPMNFTLDYFNKEIIKIINEDDKSFIVDIKFANKSITSLDNFQPSLTTLITLSKVNSIFDNDISYINEISLFKEFNIGDHSFASISYLQKNIKRVASVESYENNCNDNIILNNSKNVIGSVLGNIFILQGERIICPSSSIGRESSVISDLFIRYLQKNSFEFSYESFGVFELQVADELSVVSIKNGINPVVKYRKKIYETSRLPLIFKSFIKATQL